MLPDKPKAVIPFCDVPVTIVLMYNVWDIAAFIYDKPGIVQRNVVFSAHGENGTAIVWIERKFMYQRIEHKIIMYRLVVGIPTLPGRSHEKIYHFFQVIDYQISRSNSYAGADNWFIRKPFKCGLIKREFHPLSI